MDDKTRERLLNRLRCYLLDVVDHVTEYGCIGTVLVNDIAGKAMAAVDEAIAPQWTACKDAMPDAPMPVWTARQYGAQWVVAEGLAQWLDGVGDEIEFLGAHGHGFWVPVTHWMPRHAPPPPAPLDA